MMIQEKLILKQDSAILKQIIQCLDCNYTEFAQVLEIGVSTLEHYRRGTRQFKLSMRQVKILAALLREIGLSLEDLPDDWIIEKPPNHNHIEPSI